jgi:SAM-dependent methyltransferase
MTTRSSLDMRQGASFRDPSGFLFTRQGVLYRQINTSYQVQYDQLMSSRLYAKLVYAGLLISHTETQEEPAEPRAAYRVIQPESVAFISYPYEWSFSQLKDAALATMAIQKLALESGMVLKDASAYNIQFHNGKPTLIDTLSFEIYHEGEPWVAYRQFCQHFLAPLALMAYTDVRLSQLLRVYLDGVPLDLASHLLPTRTRYSLGLAAHLHMHAAAQKRYADQPTDKTQTTRKMSKLSFSGLMDSLESTTRKLVWKPAGTEWGDYYTSSTGHYKPAAFENKKQMVVNFLERIHPTTVWDLGANTGEFSRLAAERGAFTLAFDIDPAAVELNYAQMKDKKESNILPLVMDFTNPSAAIGWNNDERPSLLERASADVVMALAFIHHMAISNNVPLPLLAEYFRGLGRWLILEWVPKEDSQVQKLLASRQDIFSDYNLEGFKAAFGACYRFHEEVPLTDSDRILFLMESL